MLEQAGAHSPGEVEEGSLKNSRQLQTSSYLSLTLQKGEAQVE